MKQLVKLFGRQVRTQGNDSPRGMRRRQLRSETLEQRQLLAGDLLPAHNYTIPEDVNGDWEVTPLDALLILNHISRSGGNPSLEGLERGDLEHFVDVTGTNEVTPLDALRVMNRIARAEGVDEILQLHINPRTAGDEAFSASAFNAATRELMIGVNEVFNLEILYTDLRGTFDRAGAFAIYTDILVDQGGILEPVLTETQYLTISANLRQADGGSIVFSFEGSPEQTVTVDFDDFAASTNAPAREIRNAIEQLGFSNVTVTALPSAESTDPFEYIIRYNDFSLADQDIPNLVVQPQLVNSSGASLDVTGEIEDITPRIDGEINPQAVPLNMNFFSRTFKVSEQFPFGEPFFGFAGTQVGSFNDASGFTDIGATGPLLINGFEDANAGALPRPFDAFSVPVRLTQPVEELRIFLDPPNTSATQNLFYGNPSQVPNDLIRIDLDVDPNVTTDGSGVLFVTAVADQVVVQAGNGTINTTVNTPATLDLATLVSVTGSTATPTFELTSQPERGTAALDGSIVTFTPQADDVTVQPLTFTYTATVNGVSDTGTVSVNVADETVVTVEAGNGSLTAVQNGAAVTLELEPLVTVTGSTAAPTFAITTPPAFGAAAVNAATGVVTYTPPAGQSGTTSFVYSATVDGVTDTGTINVTVDPQVVTVVAADSTLNAVQNGAAVPINLRNLLTVQGGTAADAEIVITTQPTLGSVVVNAAGVASYTPPTTQSGTTSFVYSATVNGVTDTGTITVNVAAQTVVTAADSTLDAVQNGAAVPINLRDLLTVEGASAADATIVITTQPTLGSVVVNAAGVATYTPPTTQSGTTSFVYSATVNGVTDTGTITVNVAAQTVVTAADSTLTAVQNGAAVPINLRNLLTVQGGTAADAAIVITTQPTLGSVVVNAAGVATYTPPTTQSGTTSFVYSATVNGVTDTGTISVTVNPQAITVNAGNGTLDAVENGGARTLNLVPLVNVTGSTATPTFAITAQPTRGTASISSAGVLTYTPSQNQFGSDSITYRATVNGVSDTGVITINIAAIEAPPVARDDSFNIVADAAATFTSAQLTVNDSAARPNLSGQPPRVTAANAIVGTTQGTVVFNSATGSVTYTPPAGFTGTDQFRYTITSEGQTATATVTVNVQEFVPSTISGSIFNDYIESLENPVRNNVRDANEPAIGGVPVRLSSPAADNVFGQDINVVRLTDGQGNYSFDNIAPGTYTVTFETPETLLFGTRVNGSGLATGGSGRSFVVEIPAEGGRDYANLNFTVIGKTGSAAGSSSLLVSQYLLTNPNSPNNVDNPEFGLATMILDTQGSQQLFELGTANEDILFAEIAIGQSGQSAILTVIMDDGSVKSAILGEDDFIVSSNNAVVHVLRSISSLSFMDSPEELLTEEYGQYRSAVDQILAAGLF